MGWNATGDLGGLTFYTSKRRKLVFFLKAPPKTPPNFWQRRNQHRFRLAAALWRRLGQAERRRWELASRRLSLRLTGYNLWIYYFTSRDQATIDTIFRQAGLA